MAKNLKKMKKNVAFGFCFLFVINLYAQRDYFSWDFSDCDIKDILYAVSLDTQISIVPDDTVSGSADLKFAGKNFDVAFESFLKTARLYVEKTENVWTVSRCAVRSEEGGCVSFDAYDMSPASMLEKISLYVDDVITYDSLPNVKMSVHFKGLSLNELLNSLARRFGSFEVVKSSAGFHFAKNMANVNVEVNSAYTNLLVNEDGSISVDLRDALFSDVVYLLFEKVENFTGNQISYCNLLNSDFRIARAVFTKKDLMETLNQLCVIANAQVIFSENLLYLVSNENSVSEILDSKTTWSKFFLKYTSAEIIFPIIQSQMKKVQLVSSGDSSSFFAKVTDEEIEIINQIISEVDVKLSTFVVELKYLKPCEFVEKLPPSFNKEKIFIADDNSCVYFKGSDEEYKNLCEQLEIFDKPVKRISYDLLILQYDETSQHMWNFNIAADSLTLGHRNTISAQLGSVLGLNMNVVSAFGLNFAASLQASMESNSTKVFADTTLHGVSGKQINFQNTNTYRYRDNNLDPETGKPVYSGITKEIVSGITLEVAGWVSGEGMITSVVKAVVSRQGLDTSSSTGNPPPTSEKVVTTEVCGKSGEPIILSGLLQDSISVGKKGMGLLPKERTREKSQMVIYLVPHVDGETKVKILETCTPEWVEQKMNQLLGGYKNE